MFPIRFLYFLIISLQIRIGPAEPPRPLNAWHLAGSSFLKDKRRRADSCCLGMVEASPPSLEELHAQVRWNLHRRYPHQGVGL